MLKSGLLKRGLSLGTTLLLIALLFLDIIPVSSAVYVSAGAPDKSSVYVGSTIIFNNIDVTIRGPERIPIEFIEFKIFKDSTTVAQVKFSLGGSMLEQTPPQTFTVTCLTEISNIPYGYGYYANYFGYDEIEGTNHTYTYGYGYGTPGLTDIHLSYKITYLTHIEGTLRAKLFVNSTTHTYISDSSPSFLVSSFEPGTLFVDDDNADGPWYGSQDYPYRQIQDALTRARNGDTIHVLGGTYQENLIIDKTISLEGDGAEQTILQPDTFDDIIQILINNVKITGFTIQNADFSKQSGINLKSVSNCNISNNIISNNYYGIHLKYSSYNTIYHNNFSSNSKIALFLDNSNANSVKSCTLFDNQNGVSLVNCRENSVNACVFNNNSNAISSSESSQESYVQNSFTMNINGIYLESSSTTEIQYNLFTNNICGIYLASATNNHLVNNNASNNYEGITVLGSSSTQIHDNIVSFNSEKGIHLRFSQGSIVTGNYITNNTYGMYVTSSKNNTCYNNILDNQINAWDDGVNRWNITTIILGTNMIGGSIIAGNFWSDYDGIDLNGDGLGDSNIPYNSEGLIIHGGDYYPLTIPNINNPPKKPERPLGQTVGKPGVWYNFFTLTTEPEGNQIFYQWDWGDGTFSEWLGPYESGEVCDEMHAWTSKGDFIVRVKAKDEYGEESEWSDPLPIKMPRTKQMPMFTRFFDMLKERFPLLGYILQFIQAFIENISGQPDTSLLTTR